MRTEQQHVDDELDLIIVGSGAAGLPAAIEAHDGGARVLLVESEPVLGGSLRISGGPLLAADTTMQRAVGLHDDPEAFFQEYMALSQWLPDPALIRTYCTNAAGIIDWLVSFGVDFPSRLSRRANDPGLYQAGLERPMRGHTPVGSGRAISDALIAQCERRGIRTACDTRMDALIEEDGRVRGVRCGADEHRAAAVLLATGGFASNPQLIEAYYPRAAAVGDDLVPYPGEFRRGDGLTAALAVGAEVHGRNRGLTNAVPYFRGLPRMPDFSPQAIWVNAAGRRFADETMGGPAVRTVFIDSQERSVAWGIFDEAARLRLEKQSSAFFTDEVEAGRTLRAETLDALAGLTGCSAGMLARTVERFNAAVAHGVDPEFGRPLTGLFALAEGPFYAFPVRSGWLAITGAGLRIDPSFRVLDADAVPIPGLYAAGELAGGLLAENYVGGGVLLTASMVFGRAAAHTVLADVDRDPGSGAGDRLGRARPGVG